jgi:acetyltransferase-like isoleucine patch superfamily enzyme
MKLNLSDIFQDVAFGDGVQVIGCKTIQVGAGSCIGDRVWLNDCLRDSPGRLGIGRKVLIGRRSVLSTAGRLEIADYCLLAPDVYVSDTDHIFSDPFQPILQQGAVKCKELIIEENCWIGTRSHIMGGVTIGRGSVIGAAAMLRISCPPFCVMVGSPARIIKYFDFSTNLWLSYNEADFVKSREIAPPPPRKEYLEMLDANNRLPSLHRFFAGGSESF